MLYLNQTKYRHVPYNHNTDNGGPPPERRNVATSGCGLCTACMIVDHLTDKTLLIEDCVKLSEESGANHGLGTDMEILGPIVADMFDLDFSMTDDLDEMLEHLRKGGEAAALVCGDRDGEVGLFTYRRHFITLVSADESDICILDPALKDGKFEEPGREGKVRVNAPFIYCPADTLMHETATHAPKFYLFKRKKD